MCGEKLRDSTSVVRSALVILLVCTVCISSLPVEEKQSTGIFSLSFIKKTILQPFIESEAFGGIFRNKCTDNDAEPKGDLQSCVVASMNFNDATSRLFDARLGDFLTEYCLKRPVLEHCVKTYLDETRNCWKDGIKENIIRLSTITGSLTNMACSTENDFLTRFLEDDGPKCLLDYQAEIQDCFNTTLSPLIPGQFFTAAEYKLDQEECTKIRALRKCSVKILGKCEKPTAANFINTMLSVIWDSNCRHQSLTPLVADSEVSSQQSLEPPAGMFSRLFQYVKSQREDVTDSQTSSEDSATEQSDLLGRLMEEEEIVEITTPAYREDTYSEGRRKIEKGVIDLDFHLGPTHLESSETNRKKLHVDQLNPTEVPPSSDADSRSVFEDLVRDHHGLPPYPKINITSTATATEGNGRALPVAQTNPATTSETNNNVVVNCTNVINKHVDAQSLLDTTSILVISSYAVLSVIIFCLIFALMCDRLSASRHDLKQNSNS